MTLPDKRGHEKGLIFAALAVIVLAIGGLTSAVGAQDAGLGEGVQQLEDFNLEGYNEGGNKAWDIQGDTADILGQIIEIHNVDANRYGQEEVNLKARKGIMDKATGNVQLREDVVVTSKQGAQLLTDSLDWDKEKDLVSTSDPVEIIDTGLRATGKGLKAHPGLETAQLNEDVTVQFNTEPETPEKGKIVTITSTGPMIIDQKTNKATFHDNVVAVQEDRTLKADTMEIFFDPETQEIQQMICTGNVLIIQGGNSSKSDKAVYNAQEQKLTLTGRPQLILLTEGENSMATLGGKK